VVKKREMQKIYERKEERECVREKIRVKRREMVSASYLG
jgi:hypothetical protein